MDVRLPNGQVIRNVPDGTTRAQLAEKLSANGFDVPQDWMAPAQPDVTAVDRAGALAAGVNRGATSLVGLPVDTAANVIDLGKSLAGIGYGLMFTKDGQPVPTKFPGRIFDIDENGNQVPMKYYPSADIPRALQVNEMPFNRPGTFGSGAYFADKLDQGSEALTGQTVTQIPRPEDTASRYLYAAGQSLPMAAAGPRIAPQPLNVAQPTTGLANNIAANVAGSQASQFAAEKGADPATQALAGLAGGAVVSLARPVVAETTKRIFRGGEEGRQRTAQNIQDFENAGVTPTAGQATQNRGVQATEALLSKTPGGAGRMAAKSEQLAEGLGTNIEKLATQLAPKASGEQAGRAITQGVTGDKGFIAQFKAKSAENYNQLDKFVKPDFKVKATNTQQALEAVATQMEGAEGSSGALINSKLSALRAGLDKDLSAGGGAIPYKALKYLRTVVGEQAADAPFGGDVPSSQWKRLYAAMSQDMEAAAKAAGPKASAAFDRANRYHAAGMKRIDVISSVIDKNGGPEAVFRAATSGAKEGATTLRSVMQSLPPDAQKTLSASVLRRLGRATAGRQDDLGETFSTETFLTNWNTLSPQAKAVLFDRYGAGFRADMDSVAKVAANLRSGSKVFQNPSGTGQAVAQATTAGAFALSVLQGNMATAGAIATGVGAANLSARLLTYPRFVRWLAKSTQAPPNALPALIVQLEQGTEDEKEFAAMLRRQNTLNLNQGSR